MMYAASGINRLTELRISLVIKKVDFISLKYREHMYCYKKRKRKGERKRKKKKNISRNADIS